MALVKELLLKPTVPHSMVKPLMKIHRTGKFIQEPIISINLNFPPKKCAFRHLIRKCDNDRTRGLRVFLQIICLNYVKKKLVHMLKWIGGNFELLEILVQSLIKKISFLKWFTFTVQTNPQQRIQDVAEIISELRDPMKVCVSQL